MSLFFLKSNLRPVKGGSMVKKMSDNAGDVGLILDLERCPREGNGKSLLYSCLGNPHRQRSHEVMKS